MTKKRLLNFKNIFSVVIIVLFVAVIATLIVMMNRETTYDESYFVSDGSKLVSKIDPIYYEGDEKTPEPLAAYMVYYYSGEKITDVKAFYKFETEEIAKKIYEDATNKEIDWVKEKKLSHEYLIFSLVDSEFKDLNTTLVRSFTEE